MAMLSLWRLTGYYSSQKAMKHAVIGALAGVAGTLIIKGEDNFRSTVRTTCKLVVPGVLVGGVFSWVKNRPFFSRTLVGSMSLFAITTFTFLNYRGYLLVSRRVECLLPPRDHMFFKHAVSAGAGSLTCISILSLFAAVNPLRAIRTGYLVGAIFGGSGQVAYELFEWWLRTKFREQALRLHFPQVYKEMSEKYISITTADPEFTDANQYMLHRLTEIVNTGSGTQSEELELKLQRIEAGIHKQTLRLEGVDARLQELRTELDRLVSGESQTVSMAIAGENDTRS